MSPRKLSSESTAAFEASDTTSEGEWALYLAVHTVLALFARNVLDFQFYILHFKSEVLRSVFDCTQIENSRLSIQYCPAAFPTSNDGPASSLPAK